MRFEPNLGQARSGISFVSRAPGQTIFLTPTGATIRTAAVVFTINLVGANAAAAAVVPAAPVAFTHYILAGHPEIPADIPLFNQVRYSNVYDGIDVEYYSDDGLLGYRFVVHEGADIAQVRLHLTGIAEMQTDLHSGLVLLSSRNGGRPRQRSIDGVLDNRRASAEAWFSTAGPSELAVEAARYDHMRPLLVEPHLNYSSYLGGSGQDSATALAFDAAGNMYVTGWTESLGFPEQAGPRIGTPSGVDAYVAKVSPSGQLIYVTYIGGSGDDRAFGIAVDSSNAPVIAGWTYSSNFPTWRAVQPSLGGGRDAFVAKLNSSGNALIFSTYLGGAGADDANGCAVDALGNIYIAGETASSNFPVLSYYQRQLGGGMDAFAAKFTGSGALIYSTFLGGAGDDRATAIAADASGNAYITGSTYSSNFPVVNAFQQQSGGGQDAFAAKLGSLGTVLLYSTYLGGSGAGNLLTVQFGLSFAAGFAGTRNSYEMVFGGAGNTNWQQMGNWTPAGLQTPSNASLLPGSGTGSSQIFTSSYSDIQGYQDISAAFFMVAGNATGVNGCFAMWVPGGNLFYLGNDAANAWIGPIQGGGSGSLQNSQCVLHGATSSGSGAGNLLTVQFGLSFAAGFTGPRNSYEMVFGGAGNTGWQQMGTWTLP